MGEIPKPVDQFPLARIFPLISNEFVPFISTINIKFNYRIHLYFIEFRSTLVLENQ